MSNTVHMPKEMNEAVLNVMREFGSLKKTGFNQHGRYNFAPIDDFYDTIKKLLPKHGLVIIATELESDLIPMTATVHDKAGNPIGEKTTVWIKTKWQFKLCHNGVTYDDGLFRYALVPTSGPQTEGIAQSYASKNFMRDTFKVATGEYELDDMPPVEHGVPENTSQPKKQATQAATTVPDNKTIARSFYNDIMQEKRTGQELKVLADLIDKRLENNEITKSQHDTLHKVLHARRMIMGSTNLDDIERSREAIDNILPDFRKDGKLDEFLKAKEAEINATLAPNLS